MSLWLWMGWGGELGNQTSWYYLFMSHDSKNGVNELRILKSEEMEIRRPNYGSRASATVVTLISIKVGQVCVVMEWG